MSSAITTDFFTALNDRKRAWSPVEVAKCEATEGAHTTLARGLALRILEVPVGEFVRQAEKKDLPINKAGHELLWSNIEDEERHDQQLNYVFNEYKWVYEKGLTATSLSEDEKVAQQYLDYVNNDCDDHPIVKAAVLERSVFFVLLPLMRFYGNAPFRTCAQDISGDEIVHVAFNTEVQHLLKANYSKKLDKARFDLVNWMVKDLNVVDAGPKGKAPFWLRASTNLLRNGVAEELQDTQRSRVLSFFEIDNQNLPTYY